MKTASVLDKGSQCQILRAFLSFTAITIGLFAGRVHANFDQSVEEALKVGGGQIKFNLRYRFENANTKGTTKKTGNASTVRLRLGYLTPSFAGFKGFGEWEANQDVGENDYASSRNGTLRKTQFDVIQDPQDSELNQLWISYAGIPNTEIKVGRQRIKFDNDRFIGNVGWRQLEQTYDSVLITNQSLTDTTIRMGYLNQVKTIVSTTDDMDSPIFNLAYDGFNAGKLIGYAYLLDYNDSALYGRSSQTYGARFKGSMPITEGLTALYTAEYAWQKDYEHNPRAFEVGYYNLSAGVSAFGVTAQIAMEQLDGQDGQGFSTPLGTNHAFQGWADLFLATPTAGIRDIYGTLSTKVMGIKIMGVYHNFEDDTGNTDFGEEYDFLVVKKFGKHYTVLAKYAHFNSDKSALFGGPDTQKLWLQVSMSF